MKSTKTPDLSIIVTAHHEGIVAHKTMLAIEKAVNRLEQKYTYEIIITIDNGDEATLNYFKNYKNLPVKVLLWSYKDVAQSRNSAIKEATGKYISLIDADDLMSEGWLVKSLDFLNKKPYGKYVAHAQYTIEFEDFNSIVKKYGATNLDQDVLLSAFSARWNSVFIAPSKLLKETLFPSNSPGYGFEDWHVLCSFLEKEIINELIPETVIFVRRKSKGSLWNEHRSDKLLLKAHTIFTPSRFKRIDLNNVDLPTGSTNRKFKNRIKEIVAKSPIPIPVSLARRTLHLARKAKNNLTKHNLEEDSIPAWLKKEWLELHKIDKIIFPPKPLPKTYHTITEDHYNVGLAYWEICQSLSQDNYDYILFVPWLIRGGADLFAINYANTVAHKGKKVLVLATNEVRDSISSWSNKLSNDIDFIEFGIITKSLPNDQKQRVLEQLVENVHPKTLHILNSEVGFDFVRLHEKYIIASKMSILATAYSESKDDTKRVFGFSHTHVPQIYPLLSHITTDNKKIKDMWIEEYSFDENKIHVHHQPLDAKLYKKDCGESKKAPKKMEEVKILWAARLAPEKIPSLVNEIANLLPSVIHIDMYGSESKEIKAKDLPNNPRVHYKGGYDGFYNLPLCNYDLYLYTSLFDGMPNAPLEAALNGLPIIASNVGDLKQFIGENGVVVDDIKNPKAYADQIVKMIENKSLYEEKAKKLQKKAENLFSQANFDKEVDEMLRTP